MAADNLGPYSLHCKHRGLTLAVFKFTTANGAVPSSVTDGAGLLDDTTPVSRSAEGTWVMNLNNDYRDIYLAGLGVESTTDDESVHLEGTSVTAGSNTVTLRTQAGASADDIPGGVVHVALLLNLSDDA